MSPVRAALTPTIAPQPRIGAGPMNSATEARTLCPPARRGGVARLARKYSMQIAIVVVLLLIWAFFLWRSPRTFGAYAIYNALMSTTPYYALMAIPLTLVIIAKEIDLSFPSIMAWGMAAYDVVFLLFSETNPSLGVWLGFLACLLAGVFARPFDWPIVVGL